MDNTKAVGSSPTPYTRIGETARYLASFLKENEEKYRVYSRYDPEGEIDVNLMAEVIQEFYDILP